MFGKVKTLKGYKLDGIDGEIGKVEEFYFDDQHWTIRYLVANTGDWLTGRLVLISPYALVAVNNERQNVVISLTKKQVEESPSLDSDKPVSRQFEDEYYGYYGWPNYWGGSLVWGAYPFIARDHENIPESDEDAKKGDPHLRSTREVTGYHIQAIDGEIGHVEDFIIDDETWAIRYLIVNTQNWWPGKKILISPKWIGSVGWSDSKVFVKLLRETIRNSPEYSEDSLLTREYEAGLHRHYNHQGYWDDESASGDDSK